MKICMVGAGAIGGLIGAKLALAGQSEVSVLARGATLQAIRRDGLRLDSGGEHLRVEVGASGNADELGPQDLVIVAVKATALAEVARGLAPLLGPQTLVMPAMNGVPWWFCDGVPGFEGRRLMSVDPAGEVAQAIATERVLACVVHASATVKAPGWVDHKMGRRLVIGEPKGGRSERIGRVGELLTGAGFDVEISESVRDAVWYKLWGNLTMNPVSAVTGATVDLILADPLVRGFCSAAMEEAKAIGERIGCSIAEAPEDRHRVTQKLGSFKSSMLQDVEAGRAIELDAIVSVVREIGAQVGVATPSIDALLGLTRLFAQVRGLYPKSPSAPGV